MARYTRTLTAALATSLLAGAFSLPAWASNQAEQPPITVTAPHAADPTGPGMHRHAHAHKHKHPGQLQAERSAQLQALLQLQPEQHAALDRYIQATHATQHRRLRGPTAVDLRTLTTPERLDWAEQLRKQRHERMAQHAQATRSFYASLTDSQQKAFDALRAHRLRAQPHAHPHAHPGGHGKHPSAQHGHGAQPPAQPSSAPAA